MNRRLRLLYLLDLRSSPTVLPSLLSHAVETKSSPSEVSCCSQVGNSNPQSLVKLLHITLNNTSGGDGGDRTLVQHAFALKELQQYNYLTIFCF
jgi:hypothetical protein